MMDENHLHHDDKLVKLYRQYIMREMLLLQGFLTFLDVVLCNFQILINQLLEILLILNIILSQQLQHLAYWKTKRKRRCYLCR